MNLNLQEKIGEQFKRLEILASEAQENALDETYSSRATAMGALTKMLSDLVKIQETVISMDRLMRIETVTIETLKEYLTLEQQEDFLERLEEILNG